MASYTNKRLKELQDMAKKRDIDGRDLKTRKHFIEALIDADADADALPPSKKPTKARAHKPATQTQQPTREKSAKLESQKPAPNEQQLTRKTPADLPEHSIEFGLDYGTWKWVAAYVFSQHGKRRGLPAALSIGHAGPEQRMMATWIDGEFVHGHELEERANEDSMLSDKIIDYWKLPLYRHEETSDHTKRVDSILDEFGKSLDDLLCEHLKAVWRDIKAEFTGKFSTNTCRVNFTAAELEDILDRASVRITVPQMWGQDARRRMQAAAKNAGIRIAVLSYEPQCALSYIMDKEAQKQVVPHRQLHKPDCILLADIGCGTADYVNYELENDLGVNSKLNAVGKSNGALCGSLAVDEILFETLRKSKGRDWLVQTVKLLGVTERDFRRRALLVIETIKTAGGGPATIRGVGADAYLSISLTKAEVNSALDTVIATNMDHIDKFVEKRKPTVLAVTGGFSKSPRLMRALKERYTEKGLIVICPDDTFGQCYPVAVGALLRYSSISTQDLPIRHFYATMITEYYFEELHPDGRGENSEVAADDADPKQAKVKPHVFDGFYDPTHKIVRNRIRKLDIKKGAVVKDGHVSRQGYVMEYQIPFVNPRISTNFIYMQKDFDDHEPAMLYDEHTEAYSFRPGIHPWAYIEAPIPASQMQGYKVTESHGEKFWAAYGRVFAVWEGENLVSGWEIFTPSTESDDEGKIDGEVAFQVRDTVWDADHSEFME